MFVSVTRNDSTRPSAVAVDAASEPLAPDEFDLVIEAGRAEAHYWRDLWRYRELFYFLAWRDILVRYKQTALGVAWAVLQPLATTIIGTLIFSRLAKMPSGDVPYPILIFAGMLPWQFFASALSTSGQSLVSNANLITKVYFPRVIVPAAAVITALVDFAIASGVLVVLYLWFQFLPDWRLLAAPAFVLLAFAASLGAGLWLTALTVKYRDFRFVVPFLVQFGLYLSPVFFRSDLVLEKFGRTAYLAYSLNPMVSVIEGFRWCLLAGNSSLDGTMLALGLGVTGLLLAGGIRYFRRTERSFADLV